MFNRAAYDACLNIKFFCSACLYKAKPQIRHHCLFLAGVGQLFKRPPCFRDLQMTHYLGLYNVETTKGCVCSNSKQLFLFKVQYDWTVHGCFWFVCCKWSNDLMTWWPNDPMT